MGTVGYLLDTHTFLWAVRGSPQLSDAAKKAIDDTDTQKFVSAVSAYEIMYKRRIGKLTEFEDITDDYFDTLWKFGADELPIHTRHAHFAGNLEWAHRDPFDRFLAAQAFTENLTLITNDPAFHTLSWVSVLW
ncbi:MAG: type II toxin-antitoxin system VapC family toxin [Oscillospiraceae bacterium]|nr:type II toxin-antitoxin system VapC family toxin [Oscillospiraceae bacterium]